MKRFGIVTGDKIKQHITVGALIFFSTETFIVCTFLFLLENPMFSRRCSVFSCILQMVCLMFNYELTALTCKELSCARQ